LYEVRHVRKHDWLLVRRRLKCLVNSAIGM
jgi:hypothetical protein